MINANTVILIPVRFLSYINHKILVKCITQRPFPVYLRMSIKLLKSQKLKNFNYLDLRRSPSDSPRWCAISSECGRPLFARSPCRMCCPSSHRWEVRQQQQQQQQPRRWPPPWMNDAHRLHRRAAHRSALTTRRTAHTVLTLDHLPDQTTLRRPAKLSKIAQSFKMGAMNKGFDAMLANRSPAQYLLHGNDGIPYPHHVHAITDRPTTKFKRQLKTVLFRRAFLDSTHTACFYICFYVYCFSLLLSAGHF